MKSGLCAGLLEEIMEKYGIHMSDQSLQNFVIHIIIAIRRWKFYNYVKIEDENLGELRSSVAREWPAGTGFGAAGCRISWKFYCRGEILYFALHFKSKHITELDENHQ